MINRRHEDRRIASPWIEVPPEGYGGIELIVDLLTTGLHARGHDVTLFAPEGSRSDADVVSPLPAPGASSIGDPWFEAYHVLVAYREAEQFDLVHDHTFPRACTRRDAQERATGRPHAPWPLGGTRSQLLRADRREDPPRSNQRCATQHEHRPFSMRARFPTDRPPTPLERGPPQEFLVYMGHRNPDKAPELAVRLAHRASLKLVVMPRTPSASIGSEVEPPNGSEEVLAEISHDEKVDLLQRGRAFVFPIRWEEPFGLVMVEARPAECLCWRLRGAARDIVVDGETGFLRDDLDDLVTAIAAVDEIALRPVAHGSRTTFPPTRWRQRTRALRAWSGWPTARRSSAVRQRRRTTSRRGH